TKFTQHGEFRLVSDQVVQRGPAFKRDREIWIDANRGTITIKTSQKSDSNQLTKHLNLPADICNGMLFTLAKNIDPSVGATVSMVAISSKPRLVQLNIHPGEDKKFTNGSTEYRAQHYVVEIKIPGAAGRVASLVGKQPAALHLWVAKS